MKHTNRLINEKSPYLLQHAHNPVDWFPWGKEAFEKAALENKPIFLSVGYSTCHWCMVMEKESFEDENVAKVMNSLFVNVKVDREAMPDVDKVYMTFVQATTRSGGWPMSVWLTPDLKPIYGGTYFPPSGAYGRPGFVQVCQIIGDRWAADREKLVRSAQSISDELQDALEMSRDESGQMPGWDVVDQTFVQLETTYDPSEGGFSVEPKFPTPVVFNFLFTYYWTNSTKSLDTNKLNSLSQNDLRHQMKLMCLDTRGTKPEMLDHATKFLEKRKQNSKSALAMALHTLRNIAAGGIHDHVGHGFHRYSTDKYWHIPHFEKMLYDQAQLLTSYSNAYRITNETIFKHTVDDIVKYVQRNLFHPDGGFYSAEGADSKETPDSKELKEGAFAVWTEKELKDVLGSDDYKWFSVLYGVQPNGNVDPKSDIQGELKGKNVLIQRKSFDEVSKQFMFGPGELEQKLESLLEKLLQKRSERPQPNLDDKIVTSWNGLMITGLCNAYQATNSSISLELAEKSANFVMNNLYDANKGELLRAFKEQCFGNSVCDDYAFMIQGLLDLYQTNFDEKWLKYAVALQKKQDELFWDDVHGGYFGTPKLSSSILRFKDDHDGAEPSANSISLKNLIKLACIMDDKAYGEKARNIVSVFSSRLSQYPRAMPQMVESFILFQKKTKQVVINGELTNEKTREFLDEIHSKYLPTCVVSVIGPQTKFLRETSTIYRNMLDQLPSEPKAHICKDFTCGLPIDNPKELVRGLGA